MRWLFSLIQLVYTRTHTYTQFIENLKFKSENRCCFRIISPIHMWIWLLWDAFFYSCIFIWNWKFYVWKIHNLLQSIINLNNSDEFELFEFRRVKKSIRNNFDKLNSSKESTWQIEFSQISYYAPSMLVDWAILNTSKLPIFNPIPREFDVRFAREAMDTYIHG